MVHNLPAEQVQACLAYAAPAAGMVVVGFVWTGVRRARARSRNRYRSSPLSRDEIAKARAKLSNPAAFKKI